MFALALVSSLVVYLALLASCLIVPVVARRIANTSLYDVPPFPAFPRHSSTENGLTTSHTHHLTAVLRLALSDVPSAYHQNPPPPHLFPSDPAPPTSDYLTLAPPQPAPTSPTPERIRFLTLCLTVQARTSKVSKTRCADSTPRTVRCTPGTTGGRARVAGLDFRRGREDERPVADICSSSDNDEERVVRRTGTITVGRVRTRKRRRGKGGGRGERLGRLPWWRWAWCPSDADGGHARMRRGAGNELPARYEYGDDEGRGRGRGAARALAYGAEFRGNRVKSSGDGKASACERAGAYGRRSRGCDSCERCFSRKVGCSSARKPVATEAARGATPRGAHVEPPPDVLRRRGVVGTGGAAAKCVGSALRVARMIDEGEDIPDPESWLVYLLPLSFLCQYDDIALGTRYSAGSMGYIEYRNGAVEVGSACTAVVLPTASRASASAEIKLSESESYMIQPRFLFPPALGAASQCYGCEGIEREPCFSSLDVVRQIRVPGGRAPAESARRERRQRVNGGDPASGAAKEEKVDVESGEREAN
ncbi:hypothetical protein B0H11DRAFT_1909932 [Mycena galericulata]|nr:hypothetical protein B0H11DRAFT_1909932 [Mycena galericulata]